MFKTKRNYIQIIIGAVILIALAVYLQMPDQNKGMVGVLAGVGVSFALSGILSTIILRIEAKSPVKSKQAAIERKDERNISIRQRAKAKASDISCWFLMVIAYLNILIDGPLWMTLVIVGAFVIHYLLVLGFLGKYSKEM
jgi:hypothetical protein